MSIQKNNRLSVDRFEGEYAVCLDGNGRIRNIPLSRCAEVREGDIIERNENGIYVKNTEKTDIRRAEIISKQQGLWE